jgi:hypothetical protein
MPAIHPSPAQQSHGGGGDEDEEKIVVTAALFFMIAFCFIPASYASFIVKERSEASADHQWCLDLCLLVLNFCLGVISYLPTVGLVLIIVTAFGVDNYIKDDGGLATFLLFLLYGLLCLDNHQ